MVIYSPLKETFQIFGHATAKDQVLKNSREYPTNYFKRIIIDLCERDLHSVLHVLINLSQMKRLRQKIHNLLFKRLVTRR